MNRFTHIIGDEPLPRFFEILRNPDRASVTVRYNAPDNVQCQYELDEYMLAASNNPRLMLNDVIGRMQRQAEQFRHDHGMSLSPQDWERITPLVPPRIPYPVTDKHVMDTMPKVNLNGVALRRRKAV